MFQWKQEENGLSTIHSIFPTTSNPFPLPTFLKSRQASKQAANGQADVNSNVGGDLVKKTPGQQTAVKNLTESVHHGVRVLIVTRNNR